MSIEKLAPVSAASNRPQPNFSQWSPQFRPIAHINAGLEECLTTSSVNGSQNASGRRYVRDDGAGVRVLVRRWENPTDLYSWRENGGGLVFNGFGTAEPNQSSTSVNQGWWWRFRTRAALIADGVNATFPHAIGAIDNDPANIAGTPAGITISNIIFTGSNSLSHAAGFAVYVVVESLNINPAGRYSLFRQVSLTFGTHFINQPMFVSGFTTASGSWWFDLSNPAVGVPATAWPGGTSFHGTQRNPTIISVFFNGSEAPNSRVMYNIHSRLGAFSSGPLTAIAALRNTRGSASNESELWPASVEQRTYLSGQNEELICRFYEMITLNRASVQPAGGFPTRAMDRGMRQYINDFWGLGMTVTDNVNLPA